MIKLIASDMDGTLLTDDKRLPDGTFETIERLSKKNILFAAASGRQMASLERLFEPVADKVVFIAENGAYVKYSGEEIYADVMDKDIIKEMVEKISDRPNFRFLLEGREFAYTDHITMYKAMTSRKFNYNVKLIENTADVYSIDDEILKAALSDVTTHKRSDFGEMHTFFSGRCKAVLSGDNCLDFQNLHVDKGNALRKIKKRFKISYEEAMAFGDNFNDLEMLEESKFAFVMENSSDDMKKMSGAEVIGSNNSGAVIETIKKFCF